MGEDSPFGQLTETEKLVLKTAFGRSMNEVATILERSPGTIANHMMSIRTKLGGVTGKQAAKRFHDYENEAVRVQKSQGQISPISFPAPGLSDAPVDALSAGADRVAEDRAIFVQVSAPDVVAKTKERATPDLLLIRMTLLVAVTALMLLSATFVDRLIPAFERLAGFVLNFVWR